MTENRYICIHGHFYQPPRENPWLETIDYQDSARPYHDWNDRINAECYRPNGLSRILDHDGWVTRLSNNYGRISFNFGPTLLSWLEDHDPQSYASILEGDKISQEKFGGHGSAVAQCYNHIIMPLATRRDKITQIVWGLRDFESRFGRQAEAMWIPETAVDAETLEIMADHGLKFVILAPRQAQAVRPLNAPHLWESVRGEKINPRMPYQVNLTGGKSIAAFFYDGPISRAVAFEQLLNNGEVFAGRLCSGFEPGSQPQLMHIATDGESYGHHHLHGDMALAYTLDYIERRKLATITNYGHFLELCPPTQEVMVYDHSSWSCIHGIERWNNDCGCNSGSHPAWHQKWRRPLREAFDFLRDRLSPCFENALAHFTDDCWAMRDDYIGIISDRSESAREAYLSKWVKSTASEEDRVTIFKALEMQRNLILMYASCAWFFDEISGVETVQSLAYAARAIELAGDLCEENVEPEFLRLLQNAPSNIPDFENGRKVYDFLVQTFRMDFLKIATHVAARALFQESGKEESFARYDISWTGKAHLHSGLSQIIIAHLEIKSCITLEKKDVEIVAIHLGDHNLNIGALPYSGAKSFSAMSAEFTETFNRGDLSKCLRLIDKYFESNIYYLSDLCHENRKEIIDNVLSKKLEAIEEQFTHIYDQHHPVMNYLSGLRIPLPPVFFHIAHFVQNNNIKNDLREEVINAADVQRYLQEAKGWNIELDREEIEKLYGKALHAAFRKYRKNTESMEDLVAFRNLLFLKDVFPFEVDLGEIQKSFAVWGYGHLSSFAGKDASWRDLVREISTALKVRLDDES
jgi:alpha-amylase/alpha-mannosidase (GH57 family)